MVITVTNRALAIVLTLAAASITAVVLALKLPNLSSENALDASSEEALTSDTLPQDLRSQRSKRDHANAMLAILPAAAAAPDASPDADMPSKSPSIDAMAEIYERSTSANEIVHSLVELLPTLPPADQAEAAHYLVAAATDEDYHVVARLLLDRQLPADANEVLFADLTQRPPDISEPVCNALAKDAQHPLHAAAQEYLAQLQTDVSVSRSADPK